MAWIDQGRQDHGRFGHGTANSGPKQISGRASYYNLPGNQMANGKKSDPNAMNAAMLTTPLWTNVTITRADEPTKSVKVTVTDRGPYATGGVIDLTPKAFEALFGSTRIGVGDMIVTNDSFTDQK